MTSDYDKIRDDNLIEYGRGAKRYISLLGLLYPDRTHFIFELLQNAEDAGASTVYFNLLQDRLEVSHDGRCFNELDIRGVCGVGETTKLSEDLTQIGKFGIGFKSVYAYTRTPEIYSGDEHFRIEEYVRPYKSEPRKPLVGRSTLFIFPFTAPGLTPHESCKEIGSRLQSLSLRTLLFLTKVKKIHYTIHTGISGEFHRIESSIQDGRRVKLTATSKNAAREENWLVFQRLIENPESASPCNLRVEVAFKTETKDGKEKIVGIQDSELVVFFPTESQTRLGFVIQGPYKTTPSRDNIPKEEPWNRMLMTETGKLIAECLPVLRDMKLLDVSLLEALPIRMGDFESNGFVYPIVESVRDALKTGDLLPTDEGTYVSAKGAKLVRSSDLKRLLEQKQLQELFQTANTVRWLIADITQDRTPDLRAYLINQLGVEEVAPESFARKLTETFLQKQTDEWMIDFYSFLLKQTGLWNQGRGSWDPPGPLRQKRIIRIEGDTHVSPFKQDGSPNVYLNKSGSHSHLQTVKVTIAKQESASKFFGLLGIPELDLVAEVIESILPKYIKNGHISFASHSQDLTSIIAAFSTDSSEKRLRLKNALLETPFVLVENAVSGQTSFQKPTDAYMRNELTELFFSGNGQFNFASRQYNEKTLEFLRSLGVWDSLTISRRSGDWQGHVTIYQSHGFHRRGLNNFDPDFCIPGLAHVLKHVTQKTSELIWNKLAIPYSQYIRGTIETSFRKTFEDSTKRQEVSEKFGQLLISERWLPGLNGKFCTPNELHLCDLPSSYLVDQKLSDQLGMKSDGFAKLAQEIGVDRSDVEFIKKHHDEFQAWRASKERKVAFPERSSKNPERRQQRVADDLNNRPDKKYEQRSRSVRTTRNDIRPDVWLREYYTNTEDQLICQICKDEMPFRKTSGDHYFEAVEALARKYFLKEHEAQFLSLCPVCAAMYKEFVKSDDQAMEEIRDSLLRNIEPEITIKLGDWQTSIRFVQNHFQDIKTVLQRT